MSTGITVLRFRDLGAHFPVYANKGTFKPGSRGGGGTTENWKRFERSQNITDEGGLTTEDELLLFVAPHRLLLVAGFVVSIDGAVALNALNYATFSIFHYDTAGAYKGTAATMNTSATALAQYVPAALTVANGTVAVLFERGEIATIRIYKEGTGVVVNQCMMTGIVKAIEES